MSATKFVSETLTVLHCYKADCGVTFAVTEDYSNRRRRDHKSFYCPNGHSQAYLHESDTERAQREAKEATDRLARERAAHDQTRAALEHKQRKLSAAKGRITRIKNRVAAGVCPCCDRTFTNLARHMAGQHPGFTEKAVPDAD